MHGVYIYLPFSKGSSFTLLESDRKVLLEFDSLIIDLELPSSSLVSRSENQFVLNNKMRILATPRPGTGVDRMLMVLLKSLCSSLSVSSSGSLSIIFLPIN
jgi:hypothetical protein